MKTQDKEVSTETQALLDEAETRRGYISGDDYADIAKDIGGAHPDYVEVTARGAAKDAADFASVVGSYAVIAERARLTYLALDYLVQSNDVVGDLSTAEISLLETMVKEAEAESRRLN